VTLTNPAIVDHRRNVKDSVKNLEPPIVIQGVGGKPVRVMQKCSMYVFYTDPNGGHHQFVLNNCYICNVVGT
jgi:hypothetical protein